jgi:hypothetical protein
MTFLSNTRDAPVGIIQKTVEVAAWILQIKNYDAGVLHDSRARSHVFVLMADRALHFTPFVFEVDGCNTHVAVYQPPSAANPCQRWNLATEFDDGPGLAKVIDDWLTQHNHQPPGLNECAGHD